MIYLDHNGTSPSLPNHLEEVFSQLQKCAGNPSSPHSGGRAASVEITEARRAIAQALGVDISQIIFVSGATEANNIATAGVLRYLNVSLVHALASEIEHPAVLEPLKYLNTQEALNLTLINPNYEGFISAQQVIKNIKNETSYIALMAANNEVGTIQPVKLIGDFLHYKRWGIKSEENMELIIELENLLSPDVTVKSLQKLHFHVDAVQAFGKIKSLHWFSKGIDSCALSGHKLGALQGVGCLYLNKGRRFTPLILGGAQEKNRRAGTENLPGILSFGLICKEIQKDNWWHKIEKMNELRLYLYDKISQFKNVIMNSPRENVIPNTINFSICPVKGESGKKVKNGEDILLELDLNGICVSSGSACSSGANLPSKVLLAMGKSLIEAKNALRFSLSPNTTYAEIEKVVECLKKLIT